MTIQTIPYVLKILKNIYGQKQAGRIWNQHLVERLKLVGFTQTRIDECVFYRGKIIDVLYTDDSILAGPDNKELDKIVENLKAAGLKLAVEGNISDFLWRNNPQTTRRLHALDATSFDRSDSQGPETEQRQHRNQADSSRL